MLMDQDTQWLYQLLSDVQLEKFYLRVRDGLNITRIEHFSYVKESDLEQIGISKPGESNTKPEDARWFDRHGTKLIFVQVLYRLQVCPSDGSILGSAARRDQLHICINQHLTIRPIVIR